MHLLLYRVLHINFTFKFVDHICVGKEYRFYYGNLILPKTKQCRQFGIISVIVLNIVSSGTR